MRIRLDNGLVLGQAPYQIQSITGLDSPAVRNGSGVYAGADGGYMVSQYYGMRTVVVKGFFIGNCPAQIAQLRENLFSLMPLRYLFGVTIEDFAQNYWYCSGYITDIKCDVSAPRVGEYQVTFLCPDPLLYKASGWLNNGAIQENQIVTLTPGDSGVDKGVTSVFSVRGNCVIYPLIKVSGDLGLEWGFVLNGEKFAMNSGTLPGEVAYIDMKNRRAWVTVEENRNLMGDILTDSVWLSLKPGANTFRAYAHEVTTNTTVEVIYSSGYRGI